MHFFTNPDKTTHIPNMRTLVVFNASLFLRKSILIILLGLIFVLLSGRLTLPTDTQTYNAAKLKEAQDIQSIAEANLEAFTLPKEELSALPDTQAQKIKEYTDFWTAVQRQSAALVQNYHVMQRYHRQTPDVTEEKWYILYQHVLNGIARNIISAESDIILRISRLQLLESHLTYTAQTDLGISIASPRPNASVTTYLLHVASGAHYLSFFPLIALILLLHNSFSVHEESGCAKLLRSLPICSIKRNFTQMLTQGCMALLSVGLCIVICCLAYFPGQATHYLYQHGHLLRSDNPFSPDILLMTYILPFQAYFKQVAGIYMLMLSFVALFTMLLSAQTKNSTAALLIPISVLLTCLMPNTVQMKLGRLPPALTALFSPQMIVEGKAALSVPVMKLIYVIGDLMCMIGILFKEHWFRWQYDVD